MEIAHRAKQFAPFAALKGYEESLQKQEETFLTQCMAGEIGGEPEVEAGCLDDAKKEEWQDWYEERWEQSLAEEPADFEVGFWEEA